MTQIDLAISTHGDEEVTHRTGGWLPCGWGSESLCLCVPSPAGGHMRLRSSQHALRVRTWARGLLLNHLWPL